MTEKNYMTPAGLKKLTDELEHLQKVERPEICKVIAWAASNGDRSENADYIYGKKRLREIDSRIRFLLGRLEDVAVVDPSTIKSNKVQFGATVVLETENGEEKTYSIIGIDEIDSAKGYISWKSPIGRTLLGKKVGDEVVVQTPKGETEFKVLEISYKKLENS